MEGEVKKKVEREVERVNILLLMGSYLVSSLQCCVHRIQ